MCHPWPCHAMIPAMCTMCRLCESRGRVRARIDPRACECVTGQQSSTQEVTKDDVRAHTDRYARA